MVFEPVPHCGCDACDETAADGVQQLVELVAGVVTGGLTEWARRPPPAVQDLLGRHGPSAPGFGFLLEAEDGWRSGSAEPHLLSADATREVLARLPAGCWQPWPVRDAGGRSTPR